MTLIAKCSPFIAVYFAVLGLSVMVAKYIIYFDFLVVIGIVAAPALASYLFVRRHCARPTTREAVILTATCGSLVFYMFASVDIEQMHEPIVGVLFRVLFILIGGLFGYGISALYFFNNNIWAGEIAKLNKSKQKDA